MAPTTATALASGKAQSVGFAGVSPAAETACLRFYLTVKEQLAANKRRSAFGRFEETMSMEERIRQLQSRAVVQLQRFYKKRLATRAAAEKAAADMAGLFAERARQRALEAARLAAIEAEKQAAIERERRAKAAENKRKAANMAAILLVRLRARVCACRNFEPAEIPPVPTVGWCRIRTRC